MSENKNCLKNTRLGVDIDEMTLRLVIELWISLLDIDEALFIYIMEDLSDFHDSLGSARVCRTPHTQKMPHFHSHS